MVFENTAPQTRLVADQSTETVFSKPYWTSVALEIDSIGEATLHVPRQVKWT